jgi:hypothetical protein
MFGVSDRIDDKIDREATRGGPDGAEKHAQNDRRRAPARRQQRWRHW